MSALEARSTVAAFLVAGCLLVAAAASQAQEGRARSPATDTARSGPAAASGSGAAVAESAVAIEPGVAASGLARSASTAGTKAAPYRMPPLREALFAEMHNKIVHFPIVLALGGALLLVLARRRPELEPVAFWTVWAAALGALGAYFSGVFQAKEFEGEPKDWLVALHQKWGIAVGLAQAVWLLLLLRQPAKRYAWIWGLVVVVLLGVAALLGGEVAHGE